MRTDSASCRTSARCRRSGSRARAHTRSSTATSGVDPEGIAISPRGDLVATVNIRGAFPPGRPRHTPTASIALLRLDRQTGRLRRVREQHFADVLPEHASFDAHGRYLAVAAFEYLSPTLGGR